MKLHTTSNSNRSPQGIQSNEASTDALQQRISFLEKELIETRLQLALSKSSQDSLNLHIARMNSTRHEGGVASSCSEAERGVCGGGTNEDIAAVTIGKTMTVRTADPFARNKQKVHKAKRTSGKCLNPGSCSSALNLLALADGVSHYQNDSASTSSLSLALRRASRGVLNPNSCASGLNLMDSSQLRREVGSAASLLSSSGNIASLLGSARLLSSSSLSRRGGNSRVRLHLGNNRTGQNNNSGNRNADWDLFE